MSLQITVRGTAEESFPAERAIVSMAVSVEGPDRTEVGGSAAAVQEPLIEQLEQLTDRGAVSHWDAGQVRIYSHRPYDHDGQRRELMHVAQLSATAEFVDFERLSGFVDYWSGREGVEISGIRWDLSSKNRRTCESDVRRAAVDDAVNKAQGYANAVRKGRVVPIEFADPGMLGDQSDGAPQPKMARMAMSEAGGPSVTVTPETIVVTAAVDARFTTDD